MPVKSHDYQPLEVMQDAMKAAFRDLMTKIAEKFDSIQKEEKKLSLIMDTVDEQCKEMRRIIEIEKDLNV